jgi:FAD:protein FMN transferase
MPPQDDAQWMRRARPMLGTLVDIGVPEGEGACLHAAFQAMEQVQRLMSVHEPHSDLSRSHEAAIGAFTPIHSWTASVLRLALQLQAQTSGLFDVALGTGRWMLDRHDDVDGIVRLDEHTRFDLGGIAKGFAVDQAIMAAQAAGATKVWVNAGGDLRAQGLAVPVWLRNERGGGVHPWAEVQDGAMATSDFAPGAHSVLSGGQYAVHVSVAAPHCLWADALTKVVGLAGRLDHPLVRDLLVHYQAQAWIHDMPTLPP